MEFIHKIRALQIGKRKTFRRVLLAEILLILLGIVGLFGRNEVYEYPSEGVTVNTGVYQDNMTIEHISLKPGLYRIQLHYDTDTNMKNFCIVEDDTVGYRMLRNSGEHLYQGLHETDYPLWLLQKSDNIRVTVTYGGEGNYTISGLTIRETNGLAVIFLFLVVVISILVNLLYTYVQYDREYSLSVSQKGIHFGLALLLLFSSLPLLQDAMLSSGDLGYHMLRMMGIKDGILAGQFPVRIAPKWQQGYGYASSIFYGETLLYVGALFRLIGFSYITSYRLFLLFINALTILIAYYSFRKIYEDRYIGFLCTVLYTLSVYRLSKTFICGSLGNTLPAVDSLWILSCVYSGYNEQRISLFLDSADDSFCRTGAVASADRRTGRSIHYPALSDSDQKGIPQGDVLFSGKNGDLQCTAECVVLSTFC